MEQLKVIGTEDETLVLATESGERFALPIDEVLRAEMRRVKRDRDRDPASGPRPSPREIQAHIRAGLSTEEVAELMGARVEDVARFERPVLAEREHIVDQALAVPVLLAGDLEHEGLPTFGTAIRAKLAEAGATGEQWTSWKDETGWLVKLTFTAGGVERDARWTFDPKRSTLSPANEQATQLSRQGPLPEGLIPRLRALDAPEPKDETRFDSGAFGPRLVPATSVEDEAAAAPEPSEGAAREAAITRAPEAPPTATPETADLLEALRRRRGQREPLPDEEAEESTVSPVALFDSLENLDEPENPPAEHGDPSAARGVAEGAGRRKGRTAMPSWDEIVFGARTDD